MTEGKQSWTGPWGLLPEFGQFGTRTNETSWMHIHLNEASVQMSRLIYLFDTVRTNSRDE